MSKVLNRIAFGGDITKAIDRKDSETAMIIIEGATDDVILQTCDTENGTFEDFKKIAEFAENLFVGIQLKIDGCKKFVKVIGAEKASVVFGDTKYNPSDFIPVGSAGGGGESLKYHLYAWDYSNGTAIAYSEKALPQAGDVVFLKENMEGGKITDTNELKLVYHVVSDSDGVITVSEHSEGTTGGYTFNRNEADDYEEEVTDVRDVVDITQNGLYLSAKGSMFKALNTNVEGGGSGVTKLYAWIPNFSGVDYELPSVFYTIEDNGKNVDYVFGSFYSETNKDFKSIKLKTFNKKDSSFSVMTFVNNSNIQVNYLRYPDGDIEF